MGLEGRKKKLCYYYRKQLQGFLSLTGSSYHRQIGFLSHLAGHTVCAVHACSLPLGGVGRRRRGPEGPEGGKEREKKGSDVEFPICLPLLLFEEQGGGTLGL